MCVCVCVRALKLLPGMPYRVCSVIGYCVSVFDRYILI